MPQINEISWNKTSLIFTMLLLIYISIMNYLEFKKSNSMKNFKSLKEMMFIL